jgi:carboxypeptidase Q
MRKVFVPLLFSAIVGTMANAQTSVRVEKPDLDAIKKIRVEGLENSKVMENAFYLTDVSGPRLTNSPGYKRAADWAVQQLKKIGVENAHLESWGDFGKSWELQKVYVAMTAPYYKPVLAFPKAWTKGTNGLQHAELLLIDPKDSGKIDEMKSLMKGRVILLAREDVYTRSFKADAYRYSQAELDSMASAENKPVDTAAQRRARENFMRAGGPAGFITRVRDMAEKEGAVAMLSLSPRGHDGTLFVQGPALRNAYGKDVPDAFADILIGTEDYLSLYRLAKAGVPVKLDVESATTLSNTAVTAYNVVAEIPGTDPKLKDEIVMIGAHLDSWQGATGATDNAAGSAVMLEVVRIIKQSGLKPRRTIRIGLWSGEEQGLLGSRAYVKNTYGDAKEPKAGYDKFSCYFNIDNGTGKVRGIYTQGNEKVKSLFAEWLAPFKDLGASTVTVTNTGGTDHQSFDGAGLPGFQFIQDPIDYDTRTHHTTMDNYDHLIPDDLKQISTIVAAFVYNAATRDEKIPRK